MSPGNKSTHPVFDRGTGCIRKGDLSSQWLPEKYIEIVQSFEDQLPKSDDICSRAVQLLRLVIAHGRYLLFFLAEFCGHLLGLTSNQGTRYPAEPTRGLYSDCSVFSLSAT